MTTPTKDWPLVRRATEADAGAIDRVHGEAFGSPAEAQLVRALSRRADFDPRLSLVAVDGQQVVGHVLFTPMVAGSARAVSLAPLGVLPAFQRRGVGQALSRAGLAACRDAGWELVIVQGHPEYYAALGFEPCRPHGIRSPYTEDAEVFRVYAIRREALVRAAGLVLYPPEFEGV